MKDKKTKTNHQTGYHKPVVNPTQNYPMDSHKDFCKRCRQFNDGCPMTEFGYVSKDCSL